MAGKTVGVATAEETRVEAAWATEVEAEVEEMGSAVVAAAEMAETAILHQAEAAG